MVRSKLVYSVLGGAVALGLLGSAAITFAQSDDTTPATPDSTQPENAPMDGYRSGVGDQDQALADALGISLEDLEAAQLEARNAMIDQAVEDGYLTQDQADQLKENTFGFHRAGHFGIYDDDQYLADALGISVEALQTAQFEAYSAEAAAAVEAGYLTQEQADIMIARKAAQNYLDTEGLQAQVLAAYEAALNAAVADGTITQAQADAYLAQLESQSFRFGGFGDFGGGRGHRGHGGRGMPGGFNGTVPTPDSTTPDSNSTTNTSTGQGV